MTLVPQGFVSMRREGTTTIERGSNQEITKPMVMITKTIKTLKGRKLSLLPNTSFTRVRTKIR